MLVVAARMTRQQQRRQTAVAAAAAMVMKAPMAQRHVAGNWSAQTQRQPAFLLARRRHAVVPTAWRLAATWMVLPRRQQHTSVCC